MFVLARSRGTPGLSRITGHLPGGDILWLTFDTLRYDVAQQSLEAGELPILEAVLPEAGWEERHAPGNFTFASHAAMFAGFLPTPARPGRHPRTFALRFEGSETTDANTLVLDGRHVPGGLARLGYHTACVGGVGFFNLQNELGRVLPSMFEESHWLPEFGVTDRHSTRNQVARALEIIRRTPIEKPLLLFLNLSALHQPNWFYLEAAQPGEDSLTSHRAALHAIDQELAPLFDAVRSRGQDRGAATVGILCSDHGTAYGEDGYHGHRLSHECVWTVPYAEVVI